MAAPNPPTSGGDDSANVGRLLGMLAEHIDEYALFLIGLDGRILSWNAGAEGLFGYHPSEMVGRFAADLFTKEDRQAGRPERELDAACAVGRASDRNWLVRKDGSPFWANGETIALREPDGRLLGYGKVVQDITRLKQAETLRAKRQQGQQTAAEHAGRVRAEEERAVAEEAQREIGSILESISDAFYALNRDWRFTYVNQKAAEIWHKSSASLIGRPIWDVFPMAVDTVFYDELHRAVAENHPITFEAVSPVINRWIEVHAYPSASGLSVYFRDITRRKEAEAERARLTQELAEERGWLRAVIDQSPIGIILVEGADGERITANPRVEYLFGHPLPSADGIAQYVEEILLSDGSTRAREELAVIRALRGETVTSEEELLRRPDGTEARVLVSSSPIRIDNRITGAVVVYEEITRLRELERQREEWTAAIAHDLRQPITVITSYSSLLRRMLAQATARERAALDHISEAAWSLNKMIADLLEVSRIETRRLTLECQLLDLPRFAREAIERMAAITDGHPVHLEVVGTIPTVQADPLRIERVLGNLLSNAVKYGYPDSEIRVRISEEKGTVAVSVTNHGRGIQRGEFSRLFSRYYRTAEARAGKVSGLGLGLYIGRGIVEAHGGKIWAESVPGQTTTFTFTLPIGENS